MPSPRPETGKRPNTQPTTIDPDAVKLFGFRVWNYKMGEQVAVTIHLGDRLGLYAAMAGAGPLSSHDLAASVELDERLVREWLFGQAAAQLIDRHDDESFELTPVQAQVLAHEDTSIDFAAGAFRGGIEPDVLDRLAESFRTGVGISYEEQGAAAAAGLARMTAPRSRHALTSEVLPGLDGVVAKLETGATVIDVGCGGGVTLTTIAQAFPASTCIGYDPSPSAIALARQSASDLGLTNCSFVEAFAADIPPTGSADLVLCFDCLHDMPRPDQAAEAISGALAPDGTWLIKDIRSSGDFEVDRRNPLLPLLYGFSITSCLQSAMSEPGGLALGTLGLHPERAEELAQGAGFGSVRTHDFDDAANLYYEVRR